MIQTGKGAIGITESAFRGLFTLTSYCGEGTTHEDPACAWTCTVKSHNPAT